MADDRRRPPPAASPGGPPPRCPICGRPREPRFRPFCSTRCRDRDLIGWLSGRYAVPAHESEPADDGTEPGHEG